VIDDGLDFLTAEEEMGVDLERLGEMRDENRSGIDDGEAVDLGGLLLGLVDPGGLEVEDGLARGDTLEADLAAGNIHGQPAAGHELALGDDAATEEETVVVGFELEIVADRNRRNHDALLAGEALADAGDAAEQFAAGFGVGEREETIADFDREDVELDELAHILGCAGGARGRGRATGASAGLFNVRLAGGLGGGGVLLGDIGAERMAGRGFLLA